jgi:enamine deaminase RidA (YjgF/YER057c/UK114 family)
MRKRYLNPKEIHEPRFYTHAVSVSGPAKLVFVAGQVSYDRDGVVAGKGDMHAQAEQVFRNLTHSLRAAGAGWGDVIKMNGYMVGMSTDAVNMFREVRARYLDPKQYPASTLVGVERLVHEHLLLEVEVVAALADRPKAPAKRKKRR